MTRHALDRNYLNAVALPHPRTSMLHRRKRFAPKSERSQCRIVMTTRYFVISLQFRRIGNLSKIAADWSLDGGDAVIWLAGVHGRERTAVTFQFKHEC
jgi:hypothetical protein